MVVDIIEAVRELLAPKDVLRSVGLARKVLRSVSVGAGETHSIPKDISALAVIGKSIDECIIQPAGQNRVEALAFPVRASARRNEDAPASLAGSIADLEDAKLAYCLNVMSRKGHNHEVSFSQWTYKVLKEAASQIVDHRLEPGAFIMNQADAARVATLGWTERDELDNPDTGWFGTIHGALLLTTAAEQSDLIPPGTFYVVTRGAWLGDLCEFGPPTLSMTEGPQGARVQYTQSSSLILTMPRGVVQATLRRGV